MYNSKLFIWNCPLSPWINYFFSSIRYHQLDQEKSLFENLQGKEFIEYPTFHIVLPDNVDQYPMRTSKWLTSEIIWLIDLPDNQQTGFEINPVYWSLQNRSMILKQWLLSYEFYQDVKRNLSFDIEI